MRNLRNNLPRYTSLAFGAIAVAAVGTYIPDWAGALLGFGTAVVLMWRSGVLDQYAMDENIGMMLVIAVNKFGTWTPEYKLRPHVLSPLVAIDCLTTVTDRIHDDWDVPRNPSR